MSALSDLRRTRRRRRLGDAEWFDLAYHVYLAGIFGGSAIIIASDLIGDRPVGEAAVDDVFRHGPAVLGLVVIVALASGLRSGTEGGPVSIEAADVSHLLLAPVRRSAVLRRPLLQRFRTIVGGSALAGGVAGLLAAQRLPGTAPAWTLSGAAFGACVGAIVVSAATVGHAVRLRPWHALAVSAPLIAWQVWAAVGHHLGPADSLGSLALWGYRQHPGDLAGVALVLAVSGTAVALAGRLRVEHLARRGGLVSQLRFAVTTQDLRTVVLLRRQLRQEQPRRRPWVRLPVAPGTAGRSVARRGAHGLARTPLARLGRMVALAATAGLAAGVAAQGSTAALVPCGIVLFVLGLDVIEPLSQEIDRPGRTSLVPVAAGWLHERLLVAPAVLAVPLALIGATACAAVHVDAAPAAFSLAVPITWVGIGGAVVNTVRDDHASTGGESPIVPPEMAGFRDLMRLVVPVVVSGVGTLAILAVRARPEAGVVLRALLGLLLYLLLLRWWLVRRADLRQRWSAFLEGATT